VVQNDVTTKTQAPHTSTPHTLDSQCSCSPLLAHKAPAGCKKLTGCPPTCQAVDFSTGSSAVICVAIPCSLYMTSMHRTSTAHVLVIPVALFVIYNNALTLGRLHCSVMLLFLEVQHSFSSQSDVGYSCASLRVMLCVRSVCVLVGS
jgi:hypothetical protein